MDFDDFDSGAEDRFGAVRTDIGWIDQYHVNQFLRNIGDFIQYKKEKKTGKTIPDVSVLMQLAPRQPITAKLVDWGHIAKYFSCLTPSTEQKDKYKSIKDREVDELLWKQEHPQLDERIGDILEEAADFVPRILETCGIDPQANRDTLRLIETVVHIGYVVAVHFKQGFKRPRPHQVSPYIFPSIPVPAHYAFPSGHSTQAYLVVGVLKELFSDTFLGTLDDHLDKSLKMSRKIENGRECIMIQIPRLVKRLLNIYQSVLLKSESLVYWS